MKYQKIKIDLTSPLKLLLKNFLPKNGCRQRVTLVIWPNNYGNR